MKYLAALLIALFGIAFQVGAIIIVVSAMITHTDLNNWVLALAAWGTALVTGFTVGRSTAKASFALMA